MTIKIIQSTALNLSDGTPVFKLEGSGAYCQSLYQDPSRFYWFRLHEESVGSQVESLFFPQDKGDAWEIYGSDYNSGYAVFGEKAAMDALMPEVDALIIKGVSQADASLMEEEFVSVGQWDFTDGTALCLINMDDELFDIDLMETLLQKSLIVVAFGAITDDLLLQERMYGAVHEVAKKFKVPNESDFALEGYIHDDDESPSVISGTTCGRLSKKEHELFFKMAQHVFCTLMHWQDGTPGEADSVQVDVNQIFAKKIASGAAFKSLTPPTADEVVTLLYQDEKSSKFYQVEFACTSSRYMVTALYGKVDGEETLVEKANTTDLQEAQKAYLDTIQSKLARGYVIEEHPAVENKPTP